MRKLGGAFSKRLYIQRYGFKFAPWSITDNPNKTRSLFVDKIEETIFIIVVLKRQAFGPTCPGPTPGPTALAQVADVVMCG